MKKLNLFVVAILAMFVATVSVHAAGLTSKDASDWHERDWESEVTDGDDGVVTIKLTHDSNAGLEIQDGEKVILDLNNHKLTNYCVKSGNPSGCTGASAVIEIQEGGVLTITDTSSEGNGTITQSDSTEDMVAIDNKGTLNIEKGVIKGLQGVTKGSTPISVVLNQGTMKMSGGTIISNDGELSAGIHNLAKGTLTITGNAKIETGFNESWGLLNYGKTNITGGTFTQKFQYSVIQNSGDMTIEGGTFTSSSVQDAYALITNENVANTSRTGNALLTINDGNFESDIVLSYGTSKKGEAIINKGNFETEQDISEFIALGSELDDDGNVIKKVLHNIEVKENENAKIELDKYSTFEGDTVSIIITSNEGYELESLMVEDKDGKYIKVEDDQFIMPASDVTVSATLKEVVKGETNPQTGDSILMYVGMSILSIGIVLFGTKKLKRN